MKGLLAALVILQAGPAAAHIDQSVLSSGAAWTYDPWLVAPLYAMGIAVLLGTRNLWRAAGIGHGLKIKHVAAFWSGWSILAIALVSPLHWLGEHLFAAHMIEHELLIIVAAPLLTYARPSGALAWSLPLKLRPHLALLTNSAPAVGVWTVIGHPLTATALYGAALWVWHAPALYTLALVNETVHRLEHLSFFFTGLLFWWTLLHGRGRGRGERIRDAIAIGCLFLTVLHSGVLAALLTVSTRLWYPAQVQFSADFGLSPLEDQQLAGALMWVPMGALYTAAALFFAHRLIKAASLPAMKTSTI